VKYLTYILPFSLVFTLNGSEAPILTSLNDDIVQTALLASQANQNVDYQPFILSILRSDELSKLGIKTLGEALTLIPGVDMATNTMNNRSPIFRGSNPNAYGQSTIAIDGFVVNDSLFSNYNSYLDLPIELIERLEVVRGSGSFIEGVNGYAGTINVITHAHHDPLSKENGTLFSWAGSEGALGLGGWSRYQEKGWKLSLDAFTQRHEKETPISVTDAIGRSGYGQLGMDQSGFGIAYENGGFELRGRYNDYQTGSAFGNLNILPNPEGKLQQPSWYIQGKYTLPLSQQMRLIFKTSIMQNSWISDSRPLPPGFIYGGVTLKEGYWASLMVKNRRISGGGSFNYDGFEAHRITAGVESTWDEAVDMYSRTTDKDTGIGMVDYSGTPRAFINADNAKRQITNLYLSDTITLNDATAVALTLGTMRTSDIQSHIYGRAAIVYQPTRSDIFKLMVACDNRYPSFQEMYLAPSPYGTGNPDLLYERVHSIETQYLRILGPHLTSGLNIFYMDNAQQIVRDHTGQFQNFGKSIIHGAEAELHGKLTQEDNLILSYSYIHGEAHDLSGVESHLPHTASHLVKAAYSYDLGEEWSAGTVLHYVGSKKRYHDIREPLDSYTTIDASLGWNMDTRTGWYLQGVIKNIGNTVVRYPSPSATYKDDYPIANRTVWIRAGWKF
jgi:iron complex outermembrane receptor protein